MFTNPRRRLAWCAALIVIAGGVAPPGTSAQSFGVRWTDRRLSVVAVDVPLAIVLAEVARQTNSQFVGLEQVSGNVSIEFRDKTLREGVRLLLAHLNYLLMEPDPAENIISGARAWLQPPRPNDTRVADVDRDNGLARTLDEDQQELRLMEGSGFFKDASAGALLQAAQIGSALVRTKALYALGERDPAMAAEGAGAAIADPNPAVNEAASSVIAQLDDKRAVESLGAALRNPDLATRSTALELLILRGDPASLPYARHALNDESPAIRLRAEELVKLLERPRNSR